jgi:hypothetical protein
LTLGGFFHKRDLSQFTPGFQPSIFRNAKEKPPDLPSSLPGGKGNHATTAGPSV